MAEPRKPPTTAQKKPPSKASASTLNSPSRRALKSFFSCRYNNDAAAAVDSRNKCKRVRCTGSLCNVSTTAAAADISKRRASISSCKPQAPAAAPLREISHNNAVAKSTSMSSSSSVGGGSFRVMHLRRLSGCYECHMVVDPISGVSRDSSCRATIYTCADCSEIFVNAESLELHQSIRHAVSELGPEDTSRNIVEIIFQSSWLKKQTPVCKIDRILKIHNTKTTIASFEDYRDSIKSKASSKLAKKHPRCAADGNELLRFHCTTFTCSLGLDGATSLCDSIPRCKMCSIIRDGMKVDGFGRIRTLSTSGRAHDSVGALSSSQGERRAMLVCRVIAGRVGRSLLQDAVPEECDSVAAGGVTSRVIYSSNLDELFVFNPKAILPCFVVIYRDF